LHTSIPKAKGNPYLVFPAQDRATGPGDRLAALVEVDQDAAEGLVPVGLRCRRVRDLRRSHPAPPHGVAAWSGATPIGQIMSSFSGSKPRNWRACRVFGHLY
jgi:hypothetical protein